MKEILDANDFILFYGDLVRKVPVVDSIQVKLISIHIAFIGNFSEKMKVSEKTRREVFDEEYKMIAEYEKNLKYYSIFSDEFFAAVFGLARFILLTILVEEKPAQLR